MKSVACVRSNSMCTKKKACNTKKFNNTVTEFDAHRTCVGLGNRLIIVK